jgi:hypothetical protein
MEVAPLLQHMQEFSLQVMGSCRLRWWFWAIAANNSEGCMGMGTNELPKFSMFSTPAILED